MIQAVIPFAPRPGDQLSRWRQQVVARLHRPNPDFALRHRAAMTYVVNGPVDDGLVALEQLVLIVLFDDATNHGGPAIRLAGYLGQCAPWGVVWGGVAQNVFFKNLRLQPTRRARGPRLDLSNDRLLRLGLRLDRHLQRHECYPHRPMAKCPRLPPLWFAFRANEAERLTGDGPEFESACRHTGRSANDLLASSRHEHSDLVMLPLEWTSHAWRQALAVFADLSRFPKLQVFSLSDPAAELQGYQGAAQFDFYSSPFRDRLRSDSTQIWRSRWRRHRPLKALAA